MRIFDEFIYGGIGELRQQIVVIGINDGQLLERAAKLVKPLKLTALAQW